MNISPRHLINIAKRNTKTDGIFLFKCWLPVVFLDEFLQTWGPRRHLLTAAGHSVFSVGLLSHHPWHGPALLVVPSHPSGISVFKKGVKIQNTFLYQPK